MSEEQMKEFETVARPIIKWLNDNCHPHTTIIITPTCAEIMEGVGCLPTNDYLRD